MSRARKAKTKPAVRRIWVLSGPNLDLLGTREPAVYGTTTLAQIHGTLGALAPSLGIAVDCRQSNHEGTLIEWLHEARSGADAVVINGGGLTHTSVSLRDAVAAAALPTVEVHLSHIFAREEFRRTSILAPVCAGMISGFGPRSYELGLLAAVLLLDSKPRN